MTIHSRLATIACVFSGALLLTTEASAQAPAPAAPAKTAKSAATAKPKEPEPPPLPPPDVRLWVVAPSPTSQWILRIDNDGARPVRIPADVRLLELEIDVPVFEPEGPPADGAKPAAAKKKPPAKKPKPVKCAAPAALRPSSFPESRALLLAPGESYIEMFDPKLFCFDKNASALTGAAVVRARFGWTPPKVSPWAAKTKKAPEGPFAVESTDFPPAFAPVSQLSAPTILLSYAIEQPPVPKVRSAAPSPPEPASSPAGANEPSGAAPPNTTEGADTSQDEPRAPDAAPKIVDANAPRLEIKPQAFADAAAGRNVSITTTAKNAGRRAMTAVLRPRMLGYRVEGSDGVLDCLAAPPTHAVPRDMYRSYKPEATTSFTVLLAEVCPRDTFARPGLYRVTPTLFAQEHGRELGLTAHTQVVEAPAATLVRVQTGPEPFYATKPKAVPTPRQTIEDDDDAAQAPQDAPAEAPKDAPAPASGSSKP